MRVLALCVFAAGCHFSANASTISDATIDAPADMPMIDAPPDGPPAPPPDAPPVCLGSGIATVCLDSPPTTAFPGGPLDIVTDPTGPLCRTDVATPNDGSLCVVAYTGLMLTTGAITAHGARPLVLFVEGDVGVGSGATIDVGSHTGGTQQPLGPAADVPGCNAATPGDGHTGGAGGSFAGNGGNGGSPNGGNETQHGAPLTLTALRGGCPGSDGVSTATANHGAGGGAVVLLASGMVQIDGVIDAGGAAGLGGSGTGFGGGGGGGAGGLIAIVGSSLGGAGQIFASGAGGGEGGEDDGGPIGQHDGNPGADPDATSLTDGAAGGTNGTLNGGGGGNGNPKSKTGANDGSAGAGGVVHNGGGGGGGGGGFIHVVTTNASTFAGTFSPPAT